MTSDESYTPDADLSYAAESEESWPHRRRRPRQRGQEEGSMQREGGENPEGGNEQGGRGGRGRAGPETGGRGQRGGRGRAGPEPSGRSQRGRGRANAGPSARRGSRGRRGRGGRDAEEARIQVLQNERRVQTETLIQQMSEVELRDLSSRLFARQPGLVFDALHTPRTPTPPDAALPWCTCGNCREMATDLERRCCGQGPEHCISNMPHFELYCLEEGVLQLHRQYRNDVLVVADAREPGDDNRQFRYAAYRQYIFWQHGALGQGNRRVVPSCCIQRIRNKYPDPLGQYTGFVPRM